MLIARKQTQTLELTTNLNCALERLKSIWVTVTIGFTPKALFML